MSSSWTLSPVPATPACNPLLETFILLAGYVAYHFTNIILKYLLREESFLLILFILVLLAVYGLSGGLEGRARAYEILFWFVMAPLFLMLLSALDEISVDYWTPFN